MGRVAHLDTAKALGMFLVFFGHAIERLATNGIEGAPWITKVVYSFHMPLFFFLAGVFFKPPVGSMPAWLVTKLRRRILPVWFFALLCVPFWLVVDRSMLDPVERVSDYLVGCPNLNYPTWFLICLFSLELMVGVLARYFPPKTRLRLICWILAGGLLGWLAMIIGPALAASTGIWQNFWYINEALVASPFYLLGFLLRRQLRQGGSAWVDALVLAAGLAVLLTTINWNSGAYRRSPEIVLMALSSHGQLGWFYLSACAGIAATVAACRLIGPTGPLVRFVGNNTLIYLGMTGISMHFIDRPALYRLPWQPQGIAAAFATAAIYSLALMAVFAPSVFAIRRWLPACVGLRSPGSAPLRPVAKKGSASAGD